MDWNYINTLPDSNEKYYLLVEGETIIGTFNDFPTATKWTLLDVVY